MIAEPAEQAGGQHRQLDAIERLERGREAGAGARLEGAGRLHQDGRAQAAQQAAGTASQVEDDDQHEEEEAERRHRSGSRDVVEHAVSRRRRVRWVRPSAPACPRCRRPWRVGRRFAGRLRRPGRFALGRAKAAGARLGEALLHQFERRLLAGPERERRGALMEEHELAVARGRAGRLSLAQQARLRVDEVEHQQVRMQNLRRDRALVTSQPDRRRVDEDAGLRELGLDDRLVPGHRAQLHVRALRPKCLTRPSARWRCRLKTMTRWKPSVMRP